MTFSWRNITALLGLDDMRGSEQFLMARALPRTKLINHASGPSAFFRKKRLVIRDENHPVDDNDGSFSYL